MHRSSAFDESSTPTRVSTGQLPPVDDMRQLLGDATVAFSIQSVSKPFVVALVCPEIGHEAAREKLGVNSTGLPFNSVMAIELNEVRTMNPMVKPGAIATTSLLPGQTADDKWQFILDGTSRLAGRPLSIDAEVYRSEADHNQRNQGIAHQMDSYEQVIDAAQCQRVLAVLATAGLYEESGDWLCEVGLAGRSGVSGGMVTIAPGQGGLGTFSPPLDEAGNSGRGRRITRHLSHALGLDLFASKPAQPTELGAPS